ncbi:hypothetical protein ACIGXA_33910 [Streptomyces fildesensis]|uniref:Uncharacterized protein n=1 Tax=Streptomyces fildesensis TaxID=375757 RepID=A0ABW8CGD1_9ACTN
MNINFDEPSMGQTSSDLPTLTLINQGAAPSLVGESGQGEGIRGISHSPHGAVVGVNDKADGRGDGGWFESTAGEGCHGVSHSAGHGGVVGINDNPGVEQGGPGVYGESTTGEGVRGVSHTNHGAVVGTNEGIGPGLFGKSAQGPAAHLDGDVVVGRDLFVDRNIVVKGDLTLVGADYAEALTVADDTVTAGMAVVLDDGGRIRPCTTAYDARVAGIVSGAGGVPPALVLDRHDGGAPVALMGKLWALGDATEEPIRCGDLLTTSSVPGHIRRVTDRERAFGAIVGKALTDLPSGRGMVRVLVSAS